MKSINIWACLFLSVLLLSGCTRSEFEIEVNLNSKTSRSYTLQYYSSSKKQGWMSETMLMLQDGKGKVKCITRNPTVVWINSSGPTGVMPFWAERGDNITITGEGNDPLQWEIGGNSINKEWSKWRKANIDAIRSGRGERINAAVEKYVSANPDTELAVLLMLTTYVRRDNESQFASLWNKIPIKVKSAKLLAAVGRADLLTSSPIDAPVKVGTMKLHCEGDTVINIRTADADASLLWFWEGDETDRKSIIDSLKNLLSEEREGRVLDVTDVGLTQDSLAWKVKLRGDSLASGLWRRAWAPGGRMGASIAPFNVNSAPWFVVLDNKGNQKYNGPKLKEALREVRLQLRKTPARKSSTPNPEQQ